MTLDASLILGPRRCGKSEATESSLSEIEHKLYVATLWYETRFVESINQHRLRRASKWQVYEVSGDIFEDYMSINKLLCDIKTPKACLIDGLTTWIIHCAMTNCTLDIAVFNLVYCIEKLIKRNTDVIWRFVDVVPDVYDTDEMAYKNACKNMHYLLKKRNPEIRFTFWQRR